MASHSLAVAKASLAAGLMRPDPISIPRGETGRFHDSLEALLKQCSAFNVQLCKAWILENIVPSALRVAALGKYLVTLSGSFAQGSDESRSQSLDKIKPSGRRKQLHILYLLNDILHHTKYHVDSPSAYTTLAENFQPCLNDLFGFASAHSIEVYIKHNKRLHNLLDLWEDQVYYQPSYIGTLRERIADAAKSSNQQTEAASTTIDVPGNESLGEEKRHAPFIMPATHGDSSTPFYDLPAANVLPHIMPNSVTPIDPQFVKPLQFVSGPAEESLVAALKGFLRDIDSLDEVSVQDGGQTIDMDELGQWVLRDEITGDVLEGDGYYGWSRAFCEKMKRRGAGIGDIARTIGQYNKANRGSNTRSRRSSDSDSSARSRTRRNSVSPRRDMRRNGQRSIPRSRSRSRSPSKELRPNRSLRSHSRSVSRSCSYSPPPVIAAQQETPKSADPRPLPRGRAPVSQGPSPPQHPPFPLPFSQGFPPLGPGGLPVPPPPPNYKGPWPPPPPPLNSNDPAYPQMDPSIPLPTGPRTFQNDGPPLFPPGSNGSSQGRMPQDTINWDQQQQQQQHQLGPDDSPFYGSHGRGQPSFNASATNGRGRGFGQRGWVR